MKLSFAIMSVPARAAHVQKMVDTLVAQMSVAARAGFDVAGTHVEVDAVGVGPWQPWRAAWLAHRRYGSTHHVVLQDDVILCADFPDTMWCLAQARPDEFVSGFLPRKSVDQAVIEGRRWVRCGRFLWAQCVMMPVELGDAAVAWLDAREGTEESKPWGWYDDTRLGAWLRAHRRHAWVPVPHPVEHVGIKEKIGSVLGHNFRSEGRIARSWLGEAGRGSGLPWGDLAFVRG